MSNKRVSNMIVFKKYEEPLPDLSLDESKEQNQQSPKKTPLEIML
jgi:hypothetical protein